MKHHFNYVKASPKILCLLYFVALFLNLMPVQNVFCGSDTDTLVVCLGKARPESLDPAVSNTRQVLHLYHNWNDTLIYRDSNTSELLPCLARSYQQLDDGDIVFSLREGVTFHNGEPFNAEAVKFSFDLLKQPESKVLGYLEGIRDVVIIDDYTVRFGVSKPVPNLIQMIANTLFIYPPGYYKQVGKEGFGQHPVGTGPYRLVSRNTPFELIFEANKAYFGGPKGKARIPKLKVLTIGETILQMEALISGKVDLLRSGSVNPEQVPFLETACNVKIRNNGTLRVFFLVMDAKGRSGNTPLRKQKVRQAINHAIDREKIIDHAFGGFAFSPDTVLSPLHFGYDNQVTRYAYDPKKAKRLLKEASYPDGFEIDFYPVNNETAFETITENLSAVGIKVRTKWVKEKWDKLYGKFLAGNVPLAFLTWGSYSIFDAGALLNHFFMADSPACYGTTPELDRILTEADKTTDSRKRKELFSSAQKIIAQNAFWVPICSVEVVCAMRKDLVFEPSIDEIDRYFSARWLSTKSQ